MVAEGVAGLLRIEAQGDLVPAAPPDGAPVARRGPRHRPASLRSAAALPPSGTAASLVEEGTPQVGRDWLA